MGPTSAGNSGILSGVFNFVSREFESFITNATGSEPSTSQVLLDDSIDSDFSREALLVEREAPVFRRSFRKSKQPQSDPSAKNEREAKNSRRKRIKKVVASSEEDDLPSKCSRRSPKPQLSWSLKRRPSVSMPGSLFPRSPSMEPDADPSAVEKEQRVRFALHTSDPQSLQKQKSSRPLDGSASTSGSPRRHPQIVSSSVKAAVHKFHIGEDDADPSILLPSPKRSPHVLVASRNLQSHRLSSPSSPSAVATKHKRKNHSVEFFSDDSGDASGFLRVKGKEKVLIASREELYENESCDNKALPFSVEPVEHDHNNDKIRIKMLEEEIERLKQELSKKPAPMPFGEFPPPPPPPPPPPLKLPKKVLLDIPAATPESHLFASVRASLKQAPAPVENPINPLIGRRAGQPTVGLAADKMAAFLNEMKTVRLRKVSERSSGDNPAPPPSERFKTQSALRRLSSLQRSPPTIPLSKSIRAMNIANLESEIRMGEKRKHNTINIRDDADPPPKRRLRISSTDSSLAAGSSLDSSSLLPDGTAFSSCSYPPLSKATITDRTWQSGSLTEAPTPSLCSDNDIEREDISLDDQAPSTPPAPVGPSRNVYRFKGNGIPAGHESNRQIHPRPNIFDKRIPSSPFPNKSPRRPRPPSRISRPTPHLAPPSRQEDHSEEEDPLSLSFSSPDDTFPSVAQRQTASQPSTRSRGVHSPSPSSGSSSRARWRSASQVNRRRTLDEELRDIPFNHREDLEDEAIFTGVGTRSKGHGFLAHGGAGGAPVFMGIGQVEGAEEDDGCATYAEADADDECLPPYSTRGRNRQQ